MSDSEEERIAALSTFFLTTMASKTIRRSTTATKASNILVKGKDAKPKKKPVVETESEEERPRRSKSKKPIQSSSSESSSESESEEEPPRRSKSKKPIQSSSESEEEPPKKSKKKPAKKVPSSDEDSDDEGEIPIHDVPKRSVAPSIEDKVGEGLLAIAHQMAISNENNAKILEVLVNVLARLVEREEVAIHLDAARNEEENAELPSQANFAKEIEEGDVEETL